MNENVLNLNEPVTGGKWRKRRRSIAVGIGIIVLVVLLIVASWPLYFSKIWAGGKWDDAQKLDFRAVKIIEYNDNLFFFYYKQTKDTFNDNDSIDPGEYTLNDVFYRKFDGEKWGKETFLTSPADDVDAQLISASVFDGRMFVFIRSSWFMNRTGYYYNSSNWDFNQTIMTFDGERWTSTPFDWSMTDLFETMALEDGLWALSSNSTMVSYWIYDGKVWSERRSLEMPDFGQGSGDANYTQLSVFYYRAVQGRLWQIFTTGWSAEVYIRSWDGGNWSENTKIPSAADRVFFNSITSYRGRIIVTLKEIEQDWSSSYIRMIELYNGNAKARRISIDPDENTNAFSCVYQGKLIFVWSNRKTGENGKFLEGRIQARNYDGIGMSSIFTVDGPRKGHDVQIEHVVSYNGKLWIVWESMELDRGQASYYMRGYSEGYY